MLVSLKRWIGGRLIVRRSLRGMHSERVFQAEADDALGWNLYLLAFGGTLKNCASAAAEDAAKHCADRCAAADLFRGIFPAALACDGVRVGGDGNQVAVTAQ